MGKNRCSVAPAFVTPTKCDIYQPGACSLPVPSGIISSIMNRPILDDDWSDYEAIKEQAGEHPQEVNLLHRWEMNYIAAKIAKYYPETDADKIAIALFEYGKHAKHNPGREELVHAIEDRIQCGFDGDILHAHYS